MKMTTKIAGMVLLMSGTASVALACDMPPLVAIPAKEAVGDKTLLQAEATKYFDAMKTYTECVQAALTAAGGDSAPTITKAVLVQRNNSAVAEAAAVLKAYNAVVGANPDAGAGAGAAEPQGKDEGGRRRNR